MPLQALLAQLQHPDPAIRSHAIDQLRNIEPETAAGALVFLLDDTEPTIRTKTIAALNAMGKAAAEPVVRYLAGSRGPLAIEVVELLGNLNHPGALDILLSNLNQPDPPTRKAIAQALNKIANYQRAQGELNTPAVFGLLELLRDLNPEVQITAANALGEIGAQEAVNPLIDELADSHPEVRLAAARALSKIGDRSAATALARLAAEDPVPEVRNAATRALQELSDRSVKNILHSLSPDDPGVVDQVLNRLVELGDAAIPPLTELLNHDNQFIRAIAAEVLGTLGKPVTIDLLARLLLDPDANVRIVAARALGKIRHIRSAEKLSHALEDADPKVAGLAANGLELLGDLAVEPVFALLTHPSAEVRARAIDVLGRLRYQGACERLCAGLTDNNVWVRIVSAQALGEIGEPSVAPALVAALDDTNHIVRAMAAQALGKLRDYRASIKLIEMTNDPSDLVRSNTLRALGKIGNPAAIPLLIKALDDREPEIRIAAIEALADLRVTDVIEKLRRITRPWPLSVEPREVKEVARWAIESLSRITPKD